MSVIRTNSDIVKGSVLMLFINNNPVGFATSHALNLTTNTTEVSTKDHGDYPSTIVQSIGWEVTAENLYSSAGELIYMQAMMAKTPVTIKFAVSSYNQTDEKGIVGVQSASNWTVSSVIAQGEALITSYSINAPAGDNATMSVTFTGVGALTTNGDPGTQGVQGVQS